MAKAVETAAADGAVVVDMERAHYVHRVDPGQLQVEMVRNGRRFVPKAGDKEVQDLVEALLREGKQLQPCGVAKLAEGGMRLVYGFRRWLAVQVIREGGLVEPDHPLYKLEVVILNKGKAMDDRQMFFTNLAENVDRRELSTIDKAKEAQEAMDVYGCTQKQVAALLKVDPSRVSQLLALMQLPLEVHKLVESGKISAANAYEMAGLEGAALDKYLEQFRAGKKVTREQIRATKGEEKEGKEEDEEGPKKRGPKPEKKGRTWKMIQAELSEYATPEQGGATTRRHTAMASFILYATGKRAASWLARQLDELT